MKPKLRTINGISHIVMSTTYGFAHIRMSSYIKLYGLVPIVKEKEEKGDSLESSKRME